MKRHSRLPAGLRRQIEARAGGRCEYCRILLGLDAFSPVIDHVIARQHGGKDDMANLALSCVPCNAHKGPNIAGIDPTTNFPVRIFNPRGDQWINHFRWDGAVLIGITPVGRATINVLAINEPSRVASRESLLKEDAF
jgi:hypothetical protein